MTASLPLPDEQPPAADADTGVDSADAASPTPPRPRRAPRASAKDPATASAPRRTPRAPARTASSARTGAAKSGAPRATPAAKKTPAKRPAAAPRTPPPTDPGPPPPLPSDLASPAGIVIPPRPPLPAPSSDSRAVEPEAVESVEPEPVAPVEPEPVAPVEPEPEPELVEPEPVTVEPEPVEPEPVAVEPEPEPELVELESVAVEPELVEAELDPEPADDAAARAGDAVIPAAVVLIDEADDVDVDRDVPALQLRGVTKTFGDTRAVDTIDLTVPAGSFYGLVGPNGAGKTTTLSMIAGLLRPDSGTIEVGGIDARRRRADAQRRMGVLPDRLRTFDRLTGRQLLYYYGVLRGLPSAVAESRTNDLARAFDLVDALGRPVSDYSAGMTKKVMLAGAMIHSPRVLVLDEPFESVDPVSSAVILDILSTYVEHGGTVILSSHGMQLVERVCTRVAVLVSGKVLVEGTVDDVRGASTLEERFLELVGGRGDLEGLEWLHTFSD